MNKVSVIVPIYGIPAKILRDCIDSLINQTMKEIEIILVDDGNKDESVNICDEYAGKDSRVIVIHQKNQGVSVARNKGIEIAKSQYVAFVDADDWIDNDTFEVVFKYAQEEYPDIVMWEYTVEKENAKYSNYSNKKNEECSRTYYEAQDELQNIQRAMIGGTAEARKGMHGGPVCKLYKRKILLEYNLKFKPELKRSQDNEFNFRYFEYVSNALYIQKEFYHYRMFSDSATHKYRTDSVMIQELYLNELLVNFKKYNKPKIYYQDFDYIVVVKFADICKTEYAHPSNPQPLNEKINSIKTLVESEPYHKAINSIDRNKLKKILKLIVPLAKRRHFTLIYFIFILRYYIKKLSV